MIKSYLLLSMETRSTGTMVTPTEKAARNVKSLEIEPSLLHGDLWSGNAAETKDGPGESA